MDEQEFVSKPINDASLNIDVQEQISGMKQPGFFSQNKWFVISCVVAVIILGILAYFAFGPKATVRTLEAKIDFQIKSSGEVKAGEGGLYQVLIENKDSEKLKEVELELVLPQGGEITESTVKQKGLSKNIFVLPDIGVGELVRLDFKISLEGAHGEVSELKSVLHYKFQSSNLTFKKEVDYEVALGSADIDLQIIGPKEAVENQLSVFNIKYKNPTSTDFGRGRIRLRVPENFNIESTEPESKKLQSKEIVFTLSDLKSNADGELIFQGNFSDLSVKEPEFTVYFEIERPDTGFDQISDYTYKLSLANQPLSVNIESRDGNSFDPGAEPSFEVTFKNNSGKVVNGAEVELTLSGASLDLATIEAGDAYVDSSKITWSASAVDSLAKVQPGATGRLSFSVKIKNPPVKNDTKNLIVTIDSKIRSDEYPNGFSMTKRTYNINSKLSAAVTVSHVSGPLPLNVGQKTRYRVNIGMKTGSNDVKDVQLSGTLRLPKGSLITSSILQSEADNFTFTESTGKFTWKPGFLPAYTGVFTAIRTLTFDIEVQPSQTQIGQSIELFRGVTYSGVDAFTSRKFESNIGDIRTTEASGDSGYKGIVE